MPVDPKGPFARLRRRTTQPAVVVAAALLTLPALPMKAVAAPPEYTLVIRDHRFAPTLLEVPANTKVKLRVRNEDATPEEFESHSLRREKVIPGKTEAVIFVGPLKPGRYEFFGEFHMDTALGTLVAR